MPSRNVIKTYVKDGVYHVYNRGVEKRIIFQDDQDYKIFIKYLKDSLDAPPDTKDFNKTFILKGVSFKGLPRVPNNYFGKMELLAYCLMPNHFHLIVKQNDDSSLKDLMKSLLTRYVIYFNKRHNRLGPLFQDTYKAVLVNDDNYLLHLSRYIHLNPNEFTNNLIEAYSSYPEYLRLRKTKWVKPDLILKYFDSEVSREFNKFNSYKNFVEKSNIDSKRMLGEIILED